MKAKAVDTPPNPIEKEDLYLPHWCDDTDIAKGNYRLEDGCLVQYITEDQEPWWRASSLVDGRHAAGYK